MQGTNLNIGYMTQEEIINLKKFCIEKASIVCSDGRSLTRTARYLFGWVAERDSILSLKEKEAVPSPDFLRKGCEDTVTSSFQIETCQSSEG